MSGRSISSSRRAENFPGRQNRGSLSTRTTAPLKGAVRTHRACSHLTLEVAQCQGIGGDLGSPAAGNSPSNQGLGHHLSQGQAGLSQERCPQVFPSAPLDPKGLPAISHGLHAEQVRQAVSAAFRRHLIPVTSPNHAYAS